jgi:hypothetical protein
MNFIADRVKEPSTWAGFACLLGLLKVVLPQYAVVVDGLIAAAAGMAAALPERGKA